WGGRVSKSAGSLSRGRRTVDEVPPVPASDSLKAVQRAAQSRLRVLVDQAGGRFDPAEMVPVEHLDVFAELFDAWASEYGRPSDGGIYLSGRPGLWHALDELSPLQDPNRWDRLRFAIIELLESRNWRRRTPPRGSAFDVLDRGDGASS